MTPPNTQKQVRAFIVLVKYYGDMWHIQSHLLHPLTAFTSNKVKFKWKDVEQKLFDEIKHTVACNNLLIYPDFNKRFDIHTHNTDFQTG